MYKIGEGQAALAVAVEAPWLSAVAALVCWYLPL